MPFKLMFSDHRRRDSDGRSEVVDILDRRTIFQREHQRHLQRPRLRPQRQPSRRGDWLGFSRSQITTTKIRAERLEGSLWSRISRKMPTPTFSQRFHRNLNMDGGLKLPGEDWTRLALGFRGWRWGLALGLAGRAGVRARLMSREVKFRQDSAFKHSDGLRSVAISKCNALPYTPAFLDEPADLFSTAASLRFPLECRCRRTPGVLPSTGSCSC